MWEFAGIAAIALIWRVVAARRAARKAREESRRVAWNYLTRPAFITQPYEARRLRQDLTVFHH